MRQRLAGRGHDGDEWLRAYFVEDTRSRHIPSDRESRLFRKPRLIDDATTDQDLRVPPSNQWRLVFLWDAMNTPRQRERIERTKPLSAAA